MRTVLSVSRSDVYQRKTDGFFRGLSQLRRLQSGLSGKCHYRKRKASWYSGNRNSKKCSGSNWNFKSGEASGIPIIREALKLADGFTVLDCPPGSACSVMECVMDADFCVLVAEPTAFGFHNFQMVYELVSLLGKPCGVVINKQDAPYEPLEQFCREQGLPILARIPYDSHLAALAATGQIVSSHSLEMNHLFSELLEQIQQMGGVS